MDTNSLIVPDEVMIGLILFVVAIPNTVVVAVLVWFIARRHGHVRLFMYSVLAWLVPLHVIHWFYVWGLEQAAMQKGLNPAFVTDLMEYRYAITTIETSLTYSLFLVLVYLLLRIAPKRTHNNDAIHGEDNASLNNPQNT